MIHNVEISGSSYYYKIKPENPRQGQIYAVESDDYIKAYLFNEDEWMLVLGMSDAGNDKVIIECTDELEDDEDSDQIDQLDYQYRIGVI